MNLVGLRCMQLVLGVLVAVFSIHSSATGQHHEKKKSKKRKTEIFPSVIPKTNPKKTIESVTKSSKKIAGLFDIYQDTVTGKLHMLVTDKDIDREFIYFLHVMNGVSDAGKIMGAYGDEKVFKIRKYFDRIEFVTQNVHMYFDPENPLSKSAGANVSEGIMLSEKIVASDAEKGLYLISAKELFLEETLSMIKPPESMSKSPKTFKLGSLDRKKTKVTKVKNYPENTDVQVEYVYSQPSVRSNGSVGVTDPRNVSITVIHSFLKMPENDYKPRFDDPRIGYFTTKVTDMTSKEAVPYRDLIHRWHLKKKNPELALSEPVEPIVWWIENTTPHEFRDAIRKGVLEWNKAFEKAGFKDAIQVKVQPDDADWDAGDIRYNVLRWTASPTPRFGGYGPSFVNPRTGQILGADIMLEYVYHTNTIRQEKLFNFDVAGSSEPDGAGNYGMEHGHSCDLMNELQQSTFIGEMWLSDRENAENRMEGLKEQGLIRLALHEVGHTLGLNHNMKSSQVYSPGQLADKHFIEGKALTGSVMDYATINLTPDRQQQGQYYSVTVGPYDEWAIQFGYTQFNTSGELNAVLDRSTEPQLTFGNDADDMRSPGKGIDPRVMIGDLSNDQITYSIDRMQLLQDLTKDLKNKYTTKGKSYQELRQAYLVIMSQYTQAANVISRFMGGVYVDRSMAGQQGALQPYTPVSGKDQKRALSALAKYVFSPDAFNTPEALYNYLAMQRRGFDFITGTEDPKIHSRVLQTQRGILNHLLHVNTLQRIVDTRLYGNEYALSAYMKDLNNAIFLEDIRGNINSFRQNLQLAYLHRLITMVNGATKSKYVYQAQSMAIYNLKEIRRMVASESGNLSSRAHKLHIKTLIDNALKEVK